MASPELAIAKATLSATLFRADPVSTPRPTVEAFFPLLTTVATQCSRTNVQKCRVWIVDHIATSRSRSAALGKYLVALARSFSADEGVKPSLKRKRLHLLYVLNDVFHHTFAKSGDRTFERAVAPVLPDLLAQAALFKSSPKHDRKLADLVAIWEEKQYVEADEIPKLKAVLVGEAKESGESLDEARAAPNTIKIAKDTPYILPSYHGDASTPWYDLPAATWLPRLTPNSTIPMRPDAIQPLRLSGGPASESLITAVQSLLSDVDELYSKRAVAVPEKEDQCLKINELGERTILDEITGEIIGGDTYYGWSRQFCSKMKQRKRAGKPSFRGRSLSQPRSDAPSSRSQSRSASARGFKRRRRSSSVSSRGHRQRRFSRGGEELAPSRRREYSASRSRSPSASRGYAAPTRSPSPQKQWHAPSQRDEWPTSHAPPVPPPPQQGFPQLPLPPGGFPPPPAGYQGPWPPPPPPLPFAGQPNAWFMPPNPEGWNANGPLPPPPPPPPPPQQHGQLNDYSRADYDRGSSNHAARGKGGYHRGRGAY